MKKVCIVCSAKLPQPPALGGAVPVLIQHLVNQNDIDFDMELTCVSVFNQKAHEQSTSFKNTKFEYINIGKFSSFLDGIICFFLNLIKKTNKIYSWGFLFRTLRFKNGVKKVLKNNDYDVVVFENSIPTVLCMKNRKLKKKYHNKFFYHTHCVPRNWFGSGKVLQRANSVICVSKYIETKTKDRFNKYNLKTSVLYNCVDTSIFKPVPNDVCFNWRQNLNINANDFCVGFIGRISKDKGIVQLIEAIKLIKEFDLKLIIVGSTFYNSKTSDKFKQHLQDISKDISDKIVFTGYMENSSTPIFYSGCDVICLPPIWEEPGAVTNIEAAACGRPIISTNSGGNIEYIGGKSIILEKEDHEKLSRYIADSITELYKNGNKRNELATKALNWGQGQTVSKFYKNFIELIGVKHE